MFSQTVFFLMLWLTITLTASTLAVPHNKLKTQHNSIITKDNQNPPLLYYFITDHSTNSGSNYIKPGNYLNNMPVGSRVIYIKEQSNDKSRIRIKHNIMYLDQKLK